MRDILIGLICAWCCGAVVIIGLSFRNYRRRQRQAKILMIDHLSRVVDGNR